VDGYHLPFTVNNFNKWRVLDTLKAVPPWPQRLGMDGLWNAGLRT
jgi:hypothetical protein